MPSTYKPAEKTTNVRYTMIALTTLVAIMLYLDRVCLSILDNKIKPSLELSDDQFTNLLAAFFWAYALFQLPAGWLGDRYGPRIVLAGYLCCWSACTGMMGLATSYFGLLWLRFGCGMFEAGAYPLAAGIVRRWIPFSQRGMASGFVAVGGRLGGAIAPVLTVALAAGASDGWRRPFLIYGGVGIVIAVIFWFWYRNHPTEHPAVNAAESALIAGDTKPVSTARVGPPPWRAIVTSQALWLNSLVQFLANFAWVFIITLFPKFLTEVYKTPDETRGIMQSIPLYAGIVGMLLGGWVTDIFVRRFGLRWGRAWPIALTRIGVGCAYLVCLWVHDPWLITALLAVVALMTDMGTAPMWAFGQDIGGRHVGTIVGWANMWGNFGAAIAPWMFDQLRKSYGSDHAAGWNAVFLLCAASQILAMIAALGIDARKRLSEE